MASPLRRRPLLISSAAAAVVYLGRGGVARTLARLLGGIEYSANGWH